jgi:uncharacterized protein (TIGR02466 family)
MQVRHADVFPTRIWFFELPELAQHAAGWESLIAQWRQESGEAAGRSNRAGWNTDKTVFGREAFAPLQLAATAAFARAFDDMQLRRPMRFFLEAWVNLHDPGGFNMLHHHPNVLMSGTYYLRVPEGAGRITFRDPRPGVLHVPYDGTGVHCRSYTSVQPAAGQLVLFPSWLEHQVEVNASDSPRISVGINALARPPARAAGGGQAFAAGAER